MPSLTPQQSHPDLIEKLTEGISLLANSEAWQRYLDFQSRFHRYSFGNVLLIAAQCHEATQVAGFRTWRAQHRSVRKGEKAIWILAPMIYRRRENEDDEDNKVIRGFKFVPVFDVSQTEGDDMPGVCHRLGGDDPDGLHGALVNAARSIGFAVEEHEFDGSTNGECNHVERRIRIESRNPPAQRVKSLAHELAHALLHEQFDDRALAELEAESTAYVVCQNLGLDSGDYSFGYVAVWSGGSDEAIAGIRASCDRIQNTASSIIGLLEADTKEHAA